MPDICDSEMVSYRQFRPTSFDPPGLCADGMGHDDGDRGDWLVAPVSQTRDSGPLQRSNYAAMVATLSEIDPDGETWEEHRFGHWGPGWFEIIVVKPGTPAHTAAWEAECALSDYPVLDDDAYSQMEWDEASAAWDAWGASDCARILERSHCGSLDVDLSDVSSADLLGWAMRNDVWHTYDGGTIEMDQFARWRRHDFLALPGALVESRPVTVRIREHRRTPILSRRQVSLLRQEG